MRGADKEDRAAAVSVSMMVLAMSIQHRRWTEEA